MKTIAVRVRLLGIPAICCCAISPSALLAVPPDTTLKAESFDQDPGWEAVNNRRVAGDVPTISQDFGYSATNYAGAEEGEIGGQVWRSTTPASYAARIPTKTLDDRLSASGTFALTATSGSSGAFFGWFADPLNGRRNTLGFRFAGEGPGARITLQLVTGTNQACGTKVTTWIVDKTKPADERKVRPPSVKNDGTRYTWTLDYDPQANDGDGQIRFTIHSNSAEPEEFEGTHTVDLPAGYKQHGTAFNRFGLTNSAKAGNPLTIYFDDVRHNGTTEDFSSEAADWVGAGNRVTFEDRVQGGVHDFGFSQTNLAGGRAAGELGGLMWRSGDYGYYADRVGPLTLEHRLEASGTVVLDVGTPDSGMYIGWFNSASKEYAPTQVGDFVGVKVGGPTRAGHYFLPAYATTQTAPMAFVGKRNRPAKVSVDRGTGPAIVPQTVYPWTLVYDPEANDGGGAITVTLGDETVTRPLRAGDKAAGATLDRFGLFTGNLGGSFVKIYFDDLTYTTAVPQTR